MPISPTIRQEDYANFLIEAHDLLQAIEQELFNLKQDRTPAQVHNLMRAAHTLKGAAASIELDTVKSVAHVLEDVFKTLYNPEVVIDAEFTALLFQAYECLREPLMAEFMGTSVNESDVLHRSATVLSRMRTHLGALFDHEPPLPTSAELGFDLVQSMFESGVEQRLQNLAIALTQPASNLLKHLQSEAEVFLGLAESLQLKGFGEIAQTTLAALTAHPDQVQQIATLALADFRQGQAAVLRGDRTQGGTASQPLKQLAHHPQKPETVSNASDPIALLSLDALFGDIQPESRLVEALAAPVEATIEPLSLPVSLPLSPASPSAPSEPLPVVRVNLEQLERLDHLAGELLINQNQQTNQDIQFRLGVQELLASLRQHQRTLSELQSWSDVMGEGSVAQEPAQPIARPSVASTAFDALEMDRYTDFQVLVQSALNDLVQLEMVGETLEHQIRTIRQTREAQKRLLTSVQDDLTTARMQPLGEVLNRFPRLLQQLAATHHKPVEMTLSGTHVLVDKAIAEKLYNPLLHLVRNAFDHGIESPEHRRASGKPEIGQIQIHAYHQGNRTLIEIWDDGQGIDWQRVAAQAVAIGLLSPEAAKTASTAQLSEFLFHAGFSTATQVSDLSGRGVGLDMVRSQIQASKGSIIVSSTPGQGTCFTLSLPLSITITRLMVCQNQGMTYALSTHLIQQVILPKGDQLSQTRSHQKVLRWQIDQVDRMIPVYPLSELLHYPCSASSQQGTLSPVILMRSSNSIWGLQVDQMLGEQELVIRPLGTAIAPPPYVYGCSILGDSQLTLVIDPALLLQQFRQAQPSTSQPFTPSTPPLALRDAAHPFATSLPQTPAHILLIEDSLTVRQTLARTLQERGYRVSQVGDGLEGLAYLQQQADVHLIISDIEMPRMNGFEFLTQLRKTPDLQAIPVVMLTSRSSDKYRQFATELGANAFISKPYTSAGLLEILDTVMTASALVPAF
ncbi:MAG: hybrid sensor histidine kinase/response regulator [Oscillatoriophycideae cyanobacterium NC_groundwater_1537_Pr4_S-0.65um_50_18]|nr:hybrid sensor histidine kinase/response regulator [Oscillatoriophycideae cyanobacterium NC_groundwater_1537_Pr4_S-0.65um_50_18]